MANELTAGAPPVIDLGDDFQPVETEDQLRIRNQRGHRIAALLAVVIAIIVGVTASGPPVRGALRSVAAFDVAPGAVAMVVGERLFVADVRGGSGSALNAYSLANGHHLWTTPLTIGALGSVLYRTGDTILVSYYGVSSDDAETDGVDSRTGRMLWRSRASLVDIHDGRAIVSSPRSPQLDDLSSVDPADGRTLWSKPVRTDCAYDLADTYAELCADDGVLRVIDLGSGLIRATRHLDLGSPLASATPTSLQLGLTQTDGVIVVGHHTSNLPVLEGFAATDLSHFWSQPFLPESLVAACGDVICLVNRQIGNGLDPRTGAARPFPGYQAIEHRGLPIPEIGAGPVVLNTRHALIPVGSRPGPGGRYGGATALVAIADSMPLRVPSSTSVDTFIAAVDPLTEHMTIMERLHSVGVASCAALGAYLACEEPGRRLHFWRL